MRTEPAGKADYGELIEIWERSVRATHGFLGEADIAALRPLILDQYFDAVELRCVRQDGRILGFSGVADNVLEMLFVAPENLGTGVGRALCEHAVARRSVVRVDVNEQNPSALGFYRHMGFAVTGRSPVDGQGRPFPLLHMELARPPR